MPCTHSTNWSRSSRRPSAGNSIARIATPATNATARATIWTGDGWSVQRLGGASTDIGSDPAGRPVPLGVPVHVTELCHRDAVRPHGVGHLAVAVEQPLDLALVQADAHDLLLELVGDVGELRDDPD